MSVRAANSALQGEIRSAELLPVSLETEISVIGAHASRHKLCLRGMGGLALFWCSIVPQSFKGEFLVLCGFV